MNSLLPKKNFFDYKNINLKNATKNLEKTLNDYKKIVEKTLKNKRYNWENLCQPLEEANNECLKIWSPISHLHSVKNSLKLRKTYKKCLLKISKFDIWIGQNKNLYKAYKSIKNDSIFQTFNKAQQKSIKNSISNFKLSGINLNKTKKRKYQKITIKINKLKNKFNNNVLDSTMKWKKLIQNLHDLDGIPKNVLENAKKLAEKEKKTGWIITLDTSVYSAIMSYAKNRKLRKKIYYAYHTRASKKNLNEKWDNSEIIKKILILRYKIAQLLGFKNYAEKSIFNNMAKSTKEVFMFLEKIYQKAKPKAEKEIKKLKQFTFKKYGINNIKPWDIMYYSEKQKKNIFSLNDEEIRCFFPQKKVLNGLFKIINKIYGFKIKKYKNFKVWHPTVQFFKIYNEKKEKIGSLYLDLYSRKNKNSGAWMFDAINRLKYKNGKYQLPIAYIICNFHKPTKKTPFLFTHNEIITLFHEFGHALHHLLTIIDIPSVSGINGVPWDTIEFPSQFMENWCWQKKTLKIISGHYKTNEPLPKTILNNILKSKNYQSGMFILRQLQFALLDFKIHTEYLSKKNKTISSIFRSVQKKTSIIKTPSWSNFLNTFNHIFCENYAAKYYSYLWADVLASDAFSKFLKEGIFNKKIGKSFLKNILSLGGSENPKKLLKKFLKREPTIQSIFKRYNL